MGHGAEIAGIPFHPGGFRDLHADNVLEVIAERACQIIPDRSDADPLGRICPAHLPLPVGMPAQAGFRRLDLAEEGCYARRQRAAFRGEQQA